MSTTHSYSALYDGLDLSSEIDSQDTNTIHQSFQGLFDEYVDWDLYGESLNGTQSPAPLHPTMEGSEGPLYDLGADLSTSLPPLSPSPPMTMEVPANHLPTTVCPTLTTPYIPLQDHVVEFHADTVNDYVQHSPALLRLSEDIVRPYSPWSDATSCSATASLWYSSYGSTSPPSPSPSPCPPFNASPPFDVPVVSSSSKITQTKSARFKRTRSKGSAPQEALSRRSASRQARNLQLSEMPADINSLMDTKTLSCLVCHKKRLAKRLPELKRHVQSHFQSKGKKHACIGIPSGSQQVYTEDDPLIIKGIVMKGGCGEAFSRKDAYQRHLNSAGCEGPTLILDSQRLSTEELRLVEGWKERRASAH